MDNTRNDYNENERTEKNKMSAGNGNDSEKLNADDPTQTHGGEGTAYDNKTTTGSGYSEAERNAQDSTNSYPRSADNGSDELIEKYNINDQAHSDSSTDDFVKTKSAFNHNSESANDNK